MTEMNVETIREALKTVVIDFVERAWNMVKEILRRVGDNLRKMTRTALVADAPQPCYKARYERDTSWHVNRLIASGTKRQTHRMMKERHKRDRRSS
ncbi:hypothetical protein ASF99_04850 [Exiguobacterium sp. Leaf187]|uniref:hypothetical protein n=1 Tax=Exiguobacterium sp. Leaf187 TaxID=1736294 RepID=UPI0006FA3073|nr:hypothetical protein [Exiguobacterium sp. Leaf187]KQS19217.1 hypothetical protein ASF99_04850 [Exiguobacterium sp. Leaf187]